MEKQLVIFELANEHYGIDIAAVEGIVKMQEITAVPNAPEYVEGITNLRNSVLPVIDLQKRFGFMPREKTRETRIVVITMDQLKVGMIVDAVSEVLTIDDSTIEATPSIVSTVDSQFVTGIAKIDSRLVILLDLAKVLTASEKQQTALLQAQVQAFLPA